MRLDQDIVLVFIFCPRRVRHGHICQPGGTRHCTCLALPFLMAAAATTKSTPAEWARNAAAYTAWYRALLSDDSHKSGDGDEITSPLSTGFP